MSDIIKLRLNNVRKALQHLEGCLQEAVNEADASQEPGAPTLAETLEDWRLNMGLYQAALDKLEAHPLAVVSTVTPSTGGDA